jgi:hypothetical protein
MTATPAYAGVLRPVVDFAEMWPWSITTVQKGLRRSTVCQDCHGRALASGRYIDTEAYRGMSQLPLPDNVTRPAKSPTKPQVLQHIPSVTGHWPVSHATNGGCPRAIVERAAPISMRSVLAVMPIDRGPNRSSRQPGSACSRRRVAADGARRRLFLNPGPNRKCSAKPPARRGFPCPFRCLENRTVEEELDAIERAPAPGRVPGRTAPCGAAASSTNSM